MTTGMNVNFLHDVPRREIASLLARLYRDCEVASLVAGFMTVEGIETILPPIRNTPAKLGMLVTGAGTWRAFDAFDHLMGAGVSPYRLRVHLGHSRPTGKGAKTPFYRYHPMLHSKVYLFDRADGTSAALVGSHNLTGFALRGLNGEAGLLVEGLSSSPPFPDIRAHIDAAAAESVAYDPAQKDALAWWAAESMEGLARKFDDYPRDGEAKKTIVILAEVGTQQLPARGDVIYFELPAAIGRVQSLSAEVHLFLFAKLPVSPLGALGNLSTAAASFWCRTIGVEDDQGATELEADWQVDGSRPVLRVASRPFRPTPGVGMQQVRVQAYSEVRGNFEYLFETARPAFEPVFDRAASVGVDEKIAKDWEALKLIPPEHLPWFRVTGIKRVEGVSADQKELALRKMTPAEGAFILLSRRRKSKAEE